MKAGIPGETRLWRWVVNVWTFVIFFFIIADFVREGALDNILGPIAAIYIATLSIYSAEKEFGRWRFYSIGRHPGELYVFAWTALMIGMFGWIFLSRSEYRMSPEIFSTYIVVIGILAVTRKSKILFNERGEKP